MIVSAPLATNDVATLKLTSSEEIIGRIVDFSDTYISIKKPMTFMMGPQGLGLVPFMFSAPEDVIVQIPNSMIVCKTKTADIVSKQYVQQTTGLTI